MLKGSSMKMVRDYGIAILGAAVVAMLIRTFLIEAYRIPSSTMHPTLMSGDIIFVAKWPYGLSLPGKLDKLTKGRPPQYGEVIVFNHPADPRRRYVKRVVALPGDRVEIKSGTLILNGERTDQGRQEDELCNLEVLPNIEYRVCREPEMMADIPLQTIPEGHAFVLGDHRTQLRTGSSLRLWDLVPFEMIRAKARWIWLSIEPQTNRSTPSGWFSRFRFNRMFKAVH